MLRHILSFATLIGLLAVASSLYAEPTAEVVKQSKQATALVIVPTGFSTGSAFCIHPSGLFVTNEHVVRGSGADRRVKIVLNSGTDKERSLAAKVIRTDATRDIALLQADGKGPFPALKLGDDSKLTETTPVVVSGFPFGRALAVKGNENPNVTVMIGRVTAVRASRGKLSRIQFDAQVSGGSSGGPVMNEDGEVVGVVVSGVRASGIKFAIPVSKLQESLEEPVISFRAPKIEGDDRFNPVEFKIDVTSFARPRPKLDVDLILGAKDKTQRTIRAKTVKDGTTYRVTASPLPPPADPTQIRVTIQLDGSILKGTARNVSLVKELKLNDITQLRRTDDGWTVTDHRKLETDFPKLSTGTLAFVLRGGTKMNIDLKSIQTLSVILERYDDVPYRVSVKQGDKEVAFRHGVISLKLSKRKIAPPLARAGDKQRVLGKNVAMPSKPVAVAHRPGSDKGPAIVQQDKEVLTYELPGKYNMYTFGGAGRYVIFRFDGLGKAGILDVEKGKIVHEIPGISAGDLLAANDTQLFIVMPGKRLIQRWSLATFRRERMVRIEGGQTPRDAVTGAAGHGPLMLMGRKGQLFDPETLKMKIVAGGGVIGGYYHRYGYSLCVSGNGMTFGGIPTGYGAVAHGLMQVHGNRTVVRKLGSTSQAIRWAQPTADGHVIFTPSAGIYDALGRRLSAEWLDGRLIIPTFDARYFLALRYVDKNSKVEIEVGTTADRRIIYSETGFKELLAKRVSSRHDIIGATKAGREPRVQWLPKRKMLVMLPNSNDRVIFRPWDVMSRMKKSGEEYLWIYSLPPLNAYKGDKLRYQIRVVSRLGRLKYRIEDGPKGLTVSGKGQVRWDVPDTFVGAAVPVIIAVRDSAGNELIHSFDLSVGQKATFVKAK